MSNPTHLKLAGRAAIALAASAAFAAVPAAAQASQVKLATAGPFGVRGASTVTNTGPSVLNGDLGVSPGTALVGFGSPATVNGATHDNDAVASQAQSDLTTAYGVAAGQPVPPANDLTGTNLGNRTLTAGAYGYSSSAQLTGTLTLDAQGDPNAQFVFEINSTLTTASASAVSLINGASPCNVFWQVGSSATLGSTTAFKGNVMALTDISLDSGASVIGRLLARNGQITLIDNVLDNSPCARASTAVTTPSAPGTTSSGTSTADGNTPPGVTSKRPTVTKTRVTNGTPGSGPPIMVRSRPPHQACTAGFRATVYGHLIKRVVFSLDGKRISSLINSPFRVYVRAAPGAHKVRARVTFKDVARVTTLTLGYRACAAAVLHPRRGPSRFTG